MDNALFKKYTRLPSRMFDLILKKIYSKIRREDTKMRISISPGYILLMNFISKSCNFQECELKQIDHINYVHEPMFSVVIVIIDIIKINAYFLI